MVRPSQPYPRWSYFPRNRRPDEWALQLVNVVASARDAIDSSTAVGLSSNSVLASLRPGLEGLGYTVEAGKLSGELIRRPVLFSSEGQWMVEYNVDAVHDEPVQTSVSADAPKLVVRRSIDAASHAPESRTSWGNPFVADRAQESVLLWPGLVIQSLIELLGDVDAVTDSAGVWDKARLGREMLDRQATKVDSGAVSGA